MTDLIILNDHQSGILRAAVAQRDRLSEHLEEQNRHISVLLAMLAGPGHAEVSVDNRNGVLVLVVPDDGGSAPQQGKVSDPLET